MFEFRKQVKETSFLCELLLDLHVNLLEAILIKRRLKIQSASFLFSRTLILKSYLNRETLLKEDITMLWFIDK